MGVPASVFIPLFLIALGTISAILLLVQRADWDRRYRDAVVCLDYNAAFQLSQVSGQSIESVLARLRSTGFSSMAVSELTFLAAHEKGYLFEAGDDLILKWAEDNPRLTEILNSVLARRNFCIFGEEREAAARERLSLLYGDNFISVPVALERLASPEGEAGGGGWFLISIPREAEVDLNKINLGFDLSEWRRIRAAGFDIVARVTNNPKYDASDLAAVFADLQKVSGLTISPAAPADVRTVIFEGDAVLGYPNNIAATAAEIKKYGWYWGWIEFEIQDGAGALAAMLSPDVIITHSISAEEMVKQKPSVAQSRFIRALKERNVRLIYVRPFFTGLFENEGRGAKAESALEFNLEYYGSLFNAIKRHGFTVAREPSPPVFQNLHPLKLLAALGVIALAAMMMRLFFAAPKWMEPAFWIISVTGSAALFLKSPALLYSGWALVAAILAPVAGAALAIALLLRGKEEVPANYGRVLSSYLIAIAASALGGMFVYALINSAGAFVKVETFKGVMLSLALPVLLIAVYFWNLESLRFKTADSGVGETESSKKLPGWIERLNSLLDLDIKFVDMMVVFLGIAALGLILLRSGNEAPIGVAQLELLFRERLEDLLAVRPRTKELVGLPAFFFFLAYFFRRKQPSIVLLLIGAVAFTSIVNTFCHLHTPVAISLTRTLLGAALGMINGTALYLVYAAYLNIAARFRREI